MYTYLFVKVQVQTVKGYGLKGLTMKLHEFLYIMSSHMS